MIILWTYFIVSIQKFDVQNPIIGSLLQQINKGRVTEKNVEDALKGVPNTKVLDLEDRWRDLFDRKKPGPLDNIIPPSGDDDDDGDDDDFGRRPISPDPPPPYVPPSSPPLGCVPRPGAPDDQFIADRRPREYFFPYASRTERTDPDFRPPVVLDRNLREVFGGADQAFNDPVDVEETNEYADFSEQLDRGEIPEEIQFYSGGEGVEQLQREVISSNLEIGNEDFVEFLATEECQEALEKDGISIHIPSGQIFVHNENTGESLFDFLRNQQDESKKEIPFDFTYDDDYTDYMTKYLPSINEFDEVKHDFVSNQTSKFLFHLFNKYQENRGRQKHAVRHTKLSDDNYVLNALQDRNWPYFIDRIIEYSQEFFNLSDIDSSDITEINILRNTRDNFEIAKGVCNELYNSVGINLHELFKIMGYVNKKNIDTDLKNNNFFP